MRNQHKRRERRWFEQCAYFCTCHSRGRLRTYPVASRRLLFWQVRTFRFQAFCSPDRLPFPSVDPKKSLSSDPCTPGVLGARQFLSGVKFLSLKRGVSLSVEEGGSGG
jgi:hypothetical protein